MQRLHIRTRQRIIWWIFIVFFAILPFSYVPTLTLGEAAHMHIDISLIYVVLALSACGLVLLTPLAAYRKSWQQSPLVVRFTLGTLAGFGLFSLLSSAWSDNPIKGFVTAAYLCLILVVVLEFYVHRALIWNYRAQYLRVFLTTYSFAVIFGFWQIVAETIGLSAAWSQLPLAYQSGVFGYARPTGLSLEPQFFGSLLVPVILYLSYLFIRGITRPRAYDILLFASMTMLFLTLSRGAIYSFVIAIGLLGIYSLYESRHAWRGWLFAWMRYGLLVVGALLIGGGYIFANAAINQRDTISGAAALDQYVNQISLGTLDIPDDATPAPASTNHTSTATETKQPTANGYVESSTSSRLQMSSTALAIWSAQPATTLFGVGFGGFGVAAHAYNAAFPEHSIVNNYYLEVLVETGILGFGLLMLSLALLGYTLLRTHRVLGVGILVAILTQMFFYSGNANTIHVWVCIGLCLLVVAPKSSATRTYRRV